MTHRRRLLARGPSHAGTVYQSAPYATERHARRPGGDYRYVGTAQHDLPPAAEGDEGDELRQTELVVSYVLRGGVILSAAVIALGVVLFYVEYLAGRITVAAAQAFPHSFGGELAALRAGSPVAVIVLGLLLLLITPVTRVAVSIVVFALERDRLYTVITTIVLLILLISFLSGRGGA